MGQCCNTQPNESQTQILSSDQPTLKHSSSHGNTQEKWQTINSQKQNNNPQVKNQSHLRHSMAATTALQSDLKSKLKGNFFKSKSNIPNNLQDFISTQDIKNYLLLNQQLLGKKLQARVKYTLTGESKLGLTHNSKAKKSVEQKIIINKVIEEEKKIQEDPSEDLPESFQSFNNQKNQIKSESSFSPFQKNQPTQNQPNISNIEKQKPSSQTEKDMERTNGKKLSLDTHFLSNNEIIKSTMFVNLRQGAIIDFYSIGKLIGEGGYGKVNIVQHKATSKINFNYCFFYKKYKEQ